MRRDQSNFDVYGAITDFSDINDLSCLINDLIKTRTLIIVARCRVIYHGRASSIGDPAVRLIIIKPDGSLIIHEGTGREPVNWQPPGSVCTASIDDSSIALRCVRKKYGEEVKIYIEDLQILAYAKLDNKGIKIFGREKDLRDLVASNPSYIAKDASLIGVEWSTPYGTIDIVLKDSHNNIYIVEIKNEKADVSAIMQLKRYVEYFSKSRFRERNFRNIIGVIIAPELTERAKHILNQEKFIYIDSKKFRDAKRSDLLKYTIK